MQPDTPPAPISKAAHWTGLVLSALPVLALLVSGVMKLAKPEGFVENFEKLGYPERLALGIGIVELVCTALYVIPQTAVLGAILLTAYFGGATATHVRVGDPFFAPIILGVFVWLGLYLRDPRVRVLAPIRRL
jgi:uncharacterized membrane protein YphA (DoxX/SURF4 family)